MYVLEEKEFDWIPVRANHLCSCYQTWRWKQRYISESEDALRELREQMENPGEWRVSPLGASIKG